MIDVGERIRTPVGKKPLELKSSPFDHSGTPTIARAGFEPCDLEVMGLTS